MVLLMATGRQRTLLYSPDGLDDVGAECPVGAKCRRKGNPHKSLEKRVFWYSRSGPAGFGWWILLHFLVVATGGQRLATSRKLWIFHRFFYLLPKVFVLASSLLIDTSMGTFFSENNYRS